MIAWFSDNFNALFAYRQCSLYTFLVLSRLLTRFTVYSGIITIYNFSIYFHLSSLSQILFSFYSEWHLQFSSSHFFLPYIATISTQALWKFKWKTSTVVRDDEKVFGVKEDLLYVWRLSYKQYFRFRLIYIYRSIYITLL